MAAEINKSDLKILGRLLTVNQKSFILNNIMRMRRMISFATRGFTAVFQNVPFFLQVNQPRMPGYVRDGDHVRGIYGFDRSGFARMIREGHPHRDYRSILASRPCIQSLMLIGSAGSAGHTSISDLDYWVCIDRQNLKPEEIEILEIKLEAITHWAEDKHGTEVHFFLLDPRDVKAGRLGALDEESSGDVMPRLLKEEFYRTLLHVAGRIPLWWAAAPGIDKAGYERLCGLVDQIDSTVFDPLDFIDLGFVESPDPREYLGAAMWQAYKSRRDPFKAALKMFLILEQVESGFQTPLLCDQVKKAVFKAGPDDLPVDPYLMTIRRVLAFSEKILPERLDLLRRAVWFKLRAPDDQGRPSPKDPKGPILEGLAHEWGWSQDRIEDLYQYPFWAESRKLRLGEDTKALLLDLYSRIAARLRTDYPEQVRISDDSLARLNASLLARWADHENKIEDLPSDFHRRQLPQDMNLLMEGDRWRLHDSVDAAGDPVYSAHRACRVAAWLVHNQLWHPNLRLRLRTGPSPMKLRAMTALLPLLHKTFPPVDVVALEESSLLAQPAGQKVLAVNMEEASDQTKIITAEVIYRTNLGETYHEFLDIPRTGGEAEKYLFIAQNLFKNEPELTPDDVEIYVPPGQSRDELHDNLYAVLRSYERRTPGEPRHQPGRSTMKLDTD